MTRTEVINAPRRPYLRRGHPINQGLVLDWPLFEGAGDPIDPSENSPKADRSGVQWTSGPFGNALDFGTTSDNWYISIPNSQHKVPEGSSGQEVTVAGWIYPTGTTSKTRILNHDTGSNSLWFLSHEGSSTDREVYLRTWGGNTGGNFSQGVKVDTWTHFVMWWDCGTEASMMYDGGAVETTSIGDTSSGTSPITLGSASTDSAFGGRMFGFRIYDWLPPAGLMRQLYYEPLQPYII